MVSLRFRYNNSGFNLWYFLNDSFVLSKSPQDGPGHHAQGWGPRALPGTRIPLLVTSSMDSTVVAVGSKAGGHQGCPTAAPKLRWAHLSSQRQISSMREKGGHKCSTSWGKSHTVLSKPSAAQHRSIPSGTHAYKPPTFTLKELNKIFTTFKPSLNLNGCKSFAEVLLSIVNSSCQTFILLMCSEEH